MKKFKEEGESRRGTGDFCIRPGVWACDPQCRCSECVSTFTREGWVWNGEKWEKKGRK